MRRAKLLSVLACVLAGSAPLLAQGTISGIAMDDKSGTILPCIDVSLVRDDGEVVRRTRTLADGVFVMPAPPEGNYRLRFRMFGAYELDTEVEAMSPSDDRELVHRLVFQIASSDSGEWGYTSEDADRPPRPLDQSAAPSYPYAERQAKQGGEVLMRYLVNLDGSVNAKFTVSAGHSGASFKRAVERFVNESSYEPGYRAHQPVCALVMQRFVFSVRAAPPTR